MTQEEIIEYNKRCAEFLGWEYLDDFNYPEHNAIGYYDNEGNHKGIELYFHSDWNWIMEIVEKIAKIPTKYKNGLYKYLVSVELNLITGVNIEGMYARNFGDKEDFQRICFYERDFKTNTVEAINEFLIWYEQNK